MVIRYGGKHDDAIEFPGIVKSGLIETSYYYGYIKPMFVEQKFGLGSLVILREYCGGF